MSKRKSCTIRKRRRKDRNLYTVCLLMQQAGKQAANRMICATPKSHDTRGADRNEGDTKCNAKCPSDFRLSSFFSSSSSFSPSRTYVTNYTRDSVTSESFKHTVFAWCVIEKFWTRVWPKRKAAREGGSRLPVWMSSSLTESVEWPMNDGTWKLYVQ